MSPTAAEMSGLPGEATQAVVTINSIHISNCGPEVLHTPKCLRALARSRLYRREIQIFEYGERKVCILRFKQALQRQAGAQRSKNKILVEGSCAGRTNMNIQASILKNLKG